MELSSSYTLLTTPLLPTVRPPTSIPAASFSYSRLTRLYSSAAARLILLILFDELCDGLAVYDVAFPQIIGVAIELKFYPVVESFLSSQYRDSTNLVVPDLLRFIATAVEIRLCCRTLECPPVASCLFDTSTRPITLFQSSCAAYWLSRLAIIFLVPSFKVRVNIQDMPSLARQHLPNSCCISMKVVISCCMPQ